MKITEKMRLELVELLANAAGDTDEDENKIYRAVCILTGEDVIE